MNDYCAVGVWKHHAGTITHDVWIKRRNQACDFVSELIALGFENIKADTVSDGVFVIFENGISKNASEFYAWTQRS